MKTKNKAASGNGTTAKKDQFDIKLRKFVENVEKQAVNRFAELVKEHGPHNLIVYPVNELEMTAIKLAAMKHNDGDVMGYAKEMVINWAESDLDVFYHEVRKK